MIEPFIAVLIGLGIGASAGALSAFLGWNKGTEPFDTRKFISGLVTGIVAGIVAVLAVTTAIQEAVDETALLIIYAGLFVAIIGADNMRTAIAGAVKKE
jgi:hypothetical protein